MAMIRSATFGAVAALGVPTVLKGLAGPLGDFVAGISFDFNIGEVFLRWSWPIFVVVTALTFILLLITKDR